MMRKFDVPKAEQAVRDLLEALGEDLNDENVRDTPKRVAKMFSEELLIGHVTEPKLTVFPTTNVGNQLVVVDNIPVNSMCSHHLMPFAGVAHIGAYYEENEQQDTLLPGLSKYARVVERFSRRLQLQERLTSQIADEVLTKMQASWVFVYVRAEHMCMKHRGIHSPNSQTTTTKIRTKNNFPHELNVSLRSEFLQQLQLASR